MDGFERGVVRRISIEIEFPDGSIGTTEISDPGQLSAIVFDESAVLATDLCAFNVSESDWRANPAMMVHTESGAAGIPLGAHNDRQS
ncbi:hypothetical protein [Nocardia noduli]|uniref:hypothetical protein n=1 Tax=Nocardia noduli TaxID=2815722 RepID=UPI001C244E51|nr:hypothetical protein [Nocardia noduli]